MFSRAPPVLLLFLAFFFLFSFPLFHVHSLHTCRANWFWGELRVTSGRSLSAGLPAYLAHFILPLEEDFCFSGSYYSLRLCLHEPLHFRMCYHPWICCFRKCPQPQFRIYVLLFFLFCRVLLLWTFSHSLSLTAITRTLFRLLMVACSVHIFVHHPVS